MQMNKSRPHCVTFRVTDAELEKLKSRIKKSGYNNQQFLLNVALKKTVIEKESFNQLLIELKKQGVNLNQVARSCNRGNTEIEKERIIKVIGNLEVLYRNLQGC